MLDQVLLCSQTSNILDAVFINPTELDFWGCVKKGPIKSALKKRHTKTVLKKTTDGRKKRPLVSVLKKAHEIRMKKDH